MDRYINGIHCPFLWQNQTSKRDLCLNCTICNKLKMDYKTPICISLDLCCLESYLLPFQIVSTSYLRRVLVLEIKIFKIPFHACSISWFLHFKTFFGIFKLFKIFKIMDYCKKTQMLIYLMICLQTFLTYTFVFTFSKGCILVTFSGKIDLLYSIYICSLNSPCEQWHEDWQLTKVIKGRTKLTGLAGTEHASLKVFRTSFSPAQPQTSRQIYRQDCSDLGFGRNCL